MATYIIYSSLIFLGSIASICQTSKVLELTDRFPEIRRDGGLWLVKFYAPWCGHCKKMEPIWMHVAQALTRTNIKVGKVDVTRFPNVASEFKAYSTPSIKFIKPDSEHTYNGERTKDAIVNYAVRMAGTPVQEIKQTDSISRFKRENQLFFMYVGKREGPLWDVYYMIAKKLQPHAFFYSVNDDLTKEDSFARLPAIFVHKEGEYFFYEDKSENYTNQLDYLNNTLCKWVNEERFHVFPKITSENIKDVMQSGKFIVLAIVEESKIKHVPPEMLEFRNKLESVIRKKRDVYHRHFQFGWMGNSDLANSILMKRLSLPYLLILNSNTSHHYVPEDDPAEMNIEAIEEFLAMIVNSTAPVYGGNSLHMNVARKMFDLKRGFEDMWKGNPILLMVLFTLPSLFFLLIMWACCCADILDADDYTDDDDIFHEKKE